MNTYQIEKATGKIPMNQFTLFLEDIDNMEEVEFWESRLEYLKQKYVIAYREKKGRIVYSFFTNIRGKGSPFK